MSDAIENKSYLHFAAFLLVTLLVSSPPSALAVEGSQPYCNRPPGGGVAGRLHDQQARVAGDGGVGSPVAFQHPFIDPPAKVQNLTDFSAFEFLLGNQTFAVKGPKSFINFPIQLPDGQSIFIPAKIKSARYDPSMNTYRIEVFIADGEKVPLDKLRTQSLSPYEMANMRSQEAGTIQRNLPVAIVRADYLPSATSPVFSVEKSKLPANQAFFPKQILHELHTEDMTAKIGIHGDESFVSYVPDGLDARGPAKITKIWVDQFGQTHVEGIKGRPALPGKPSNMEVEEFNNYEIASMRPSSTSKNSFVSARYDFNQFQYRSSTPRWDPTKIQMTTHYDWTDVNPPIRLKVGDPIAVPNKDGFVTGKVHSLGRDPTGRLRISAEVEIRVKSGDGSVVIAPVLMEVSPEGIQHYLASHSPKAPEPNPLALGVMKNAIAQGPPPIPAAVRAPKIDPSIDVAAVPHRAQQILPGVDLANLTADRVEPYRGKYVVAKIDDVNVVGRFEYGTTGAMYNQDGFKFQAVNPHTLDDLVDPLSPAQKVIYRVKPEHLMLDGFTPKPGKEAQIFDSFDENQARYRVPPEARMARDLSRFEDKYVRLKIGGRQIDGFIPFDNGAPRIDHGGIVFIETKPERQKDRAGSEQIVPGAVREHRILASDLTTGEVKFERAVEDYDQLVREPIREQRTIAAGSAQEKILSDLATNPSKLRTYSWDNRSVTGTPVIDTDGSPMIVIRGPVDKFLQIMTEAGEVAEVPVSDLGSRVRVTTGEEKSASNSVSTAQRRAGFPAEAGKTLAVAAPMQGSAANPQLIEKRLVMFRGHPTQPSPPVGSKGTNIHIHPQTGQEILIHHRAEGREYAKRSGKLFEEASISDLPRGRKYTWVALANGKMTFGQVDQTFEVGVKHLQLANGENVFAAGELSINNDGSYDWNLESGTFTVPILSHGDFAENERKMATAMNSIFASETTAPGRYVKRKLLPNNFPTPSELARMCLHPEFRVLNPSLCR